jgi:PAS domain S-box-containing protein
MSREDSTRRTSSTRRSRILTADQSAAHERTRFAQHAVDLLERVSDGFVALDKDWYYTYVNRQAAALFGRRPEDLIGRHIWTEFPEGVGQPFHLAYERAMAEQVFIELEAFYEPWKRWFENRIYPSPVGLAIFFHEITERKEAEQAARTSAELLKAQNHALELIARDTPLHETLDRLLRAIDAQASGMLSSILLLDSDGVHVRHAAAPNLPDSYVRAIDGEAIGPDSGSPGTAAYRREPVIVEDIATDPLWDRYRAVALAHGLRACWSTPILDGQQRVLGTFALYSRTPGGPTERDRQFVDVTTYTAAIAIVKHRESQEAKRREAQFREAERIAQLGSYDWDVRSNAAHRSEELCRIFGLRLEEFPPTFEAYLERVHPADRSRTKEIIERAVRERTPFEFEERIVRPDGTVRQLRSQGQWVVDKDGEPLKLVGICQDITERKRAEEQLRRSEQLRVRNEELKAFAYMVSHDLKAPLRSMAGYARELSGEHRAGLDERAVRCVDEIVAGTERLDRLIEDLLHYSRLDAETPTATDVDLAQMVESVVAERRSVIGAHGTQISIALDVTHLRTWERGVTQIFTNLIDNAIKFSRNATPPRIEISTGGTMDHVRIIVADNGIGFDMKHRDRIFGLFSRLVGADEFEGTGAGLAIVNKIAEKIGARVWAESTPGAGARFVVEVPHTGAAS